jgi:RHS repeat-associated protein
MPTATPVLTITKPDGSTEITATYLDGTLKSTTGSGVPDVFYQYGTHTEQGGGSWTKTIKGASSGTEWTKEYTDLLGRPIKTEYPDGAVAVKTYFPPDASSGSIGKLSGSRDPDGVESAITYNLEGELSTFTEDIPGGQHRITSSETDVVDDPLLGVAYRSRKWINGVLITSEFTSSEGRASRSEALGVTTTWSQTLPSDGAWTSTSTSGDSQKVVKTYVEGNLAKTEFFDNQDNSVSWTSRTYGAFDRLATETDSRTGAVTFNSYTESGNLLSSADAGSRTSAWSYDVMGRTITIDQPDTTDAGGSPLENVTHTSYHPNGEIAAVWGDQTNPTYRTYDEQNRLVGLRTYRALAHGTQPVAGTSGYDLTTWNYDSQRGWLDSKRGAANLGVDYTYTPAGRLETRKWARTVGGGARLTTTYTYNAGKLATTSYNDGVTQAVGYTYDSFGRQSQVTQGGNSWVYGYDPATLQLTSETVTYDTDFNGIGDFTRVLSRSQDAKLRPTGYQFKDGTTIEAQAAYAYDDAIRLHTVGDGTDTFSYGYQPGSQLVQTITGPVHTVTNTWDTARNALLTKENKVGTTVVSEYGYTVNALGQRTALAASGSAFGGVPASIGWGYNARGEVVSANHSDTPQSRFYEFDPIGNRKKSRTGTATDSGGTLTTYTANSLNQYTAINAAAPTHDGDGNQLSGPSPLGPSPLGPSHTSGYTWDGENRLLTASDNASPVGGYRYDPFGRRIMKNASGGSTWFLYDGWNLVGEYQAGALVKAHLWGLDLAGQSRGDVRQLQSAGGVGGLLAANVIRTSDSTALGNLYTSYDGNGNILGWSGADGMLKQSQDYDAFGNVVLNHTDPAGPLATGQGELYYGFSTKPEDKESGLLYYGFRYYQPETGRWLSRDPIGERGGVNLYGFVKNNGVSRIDYLGLFLDDFFDDFGDLFGDESDEGNDIPNGGPDGKSDFLHHYYHGNGADFDLFQRGYGDRLKKAVDPVVIPSLEGKLGQISQELCGSGIQRKTITRASREAVTVQHPDLTKVIFSVGDTTIVSNADGKLCVDCNKRTWTFDGKRFHSVDDRFTDPLNIDQATFGLWPGTGDLPSSKPYDIKGNWEEDFKTSGSF